MSDEPQNSSSPKAFDIHETEEADECEWLDD